MSFNGAADDTLDRLIRKQFWDENGHFQVPAVYKESDDYKTMRILSQKIRSDANWIDSLKTPETRKCLIAEAREKLEEAAVKTMFDKLDFLATLQPKEGAKLGSIDYVWLSDTLVDSAT
ncbi:hypothetical protein GGI05_005909, partial [Coemansia sp. RSA 2603]